MSAYQELESLGIVIPPLTEPAGAFVPFVQTGNLLFLSGKIARREGKPWVGQLGAGISTEEGAAAARTVAIELIGALHAATADLGRVRRIVKLLVLVNSAPTFTEQHLVANGASLLLQQVFGAEGKHARSAFGVAQLPLGACVEIELVAEVG